MQGDSSPATHTTLGDEVVKFRDEFGVVRCKAGLVIEKHYKLKGACCDRSRHHGPKQDSIYVSAAELKKSNQVKGYEDDPLAQYKVKRRGDELIYEAVAKRRTEDVVRIVEIMREEPNNIFVLRAGCQSMLELAYNDPLMKKNIRKMEGIEVLITAFMTCLDAEKVGARTRVVDGLIDEDWPSVQADICGVFRQVACNNQGNAKLIGELGGPLLAVDAMRAHPDDPDMMERGCGAVAWLAHEDELCRIVFLLAGALPICEAARACFRHRNTYVVNAAVSACKVLEEGHRLVPAHILPGYHEVWRMIRERTDSDLLGRGAKFMYQVAARMIIGEIPCLEAMATARTMFPNPLDLGIILAFDDLLPTGSRIRPTERTLLVDEYEEALKGQKERETVAKDRRRAKNQIVTQAQSRSLRARADVCVLRDLLPLPPRKLYAHNHRSFNTIHHDFTQWGYGKPAPPIARYFPTEYTNKGSLIDSQKSKDPHPTLTRLMKDSYLDLNSTHKQLHALIHSSASPGM
eukprot:g3154.t1